MSVRFVIGRAGAGKTHHCLTQVRARVLAEPLNGPVLILLVPEQASLQSERALLDHPDLAAVHRASVLSFQRLAFRILEGVPDSRRVLSADGRRMVLRHLIQRLSSELRYFKRPERFPGFLERLGQTLDEFIQEDVSPADLAGAIGSSENPSHLMRLHDLQRIYAAYLDFLGAERVDPSQRLDLARQRVRSCAWLNGAEIWVDGFAGFTRQERGVLLALAQVAARMEITLLLESAECGVRSAESDSLFVKTARTYSTLQRAFEEFGIEVHPPLAPDPSVPRRFRDAPDLAGIERKVFQPHTPHSALRTPHSAVHVVQAADRRAEVAYVAAAISHLVQTDERIRYRDIGLALRDLGPYHDLLTAALEARGVPYFIDRRRPTRHHPLVECVRGLVHAALDPFAPEAIRPLLKCGLLPLDAEQVDALENHLIAAAPKSAEEWNGRWKDRAARGLQPTIRLNRARRRMLKALTPWLTFAAERPSRSSAEWSVGLTGQLARMKVPWRLQRWIESAEALGDLDRAEEHRQIQTDLAALLDDLATLLPDEPLTLRDLAQMLDAALANLTLGLTPPTLDQVLITAVERSRNPDLKVLFLLGFNDGHFPRTPTEDALLGDDERAWLAARDVELRPATTELLRDERLLAYIAFTRPSHKLIVSYAAAAEDGRELRPSPWLDDLRAACPSAGFTTAGDPYRSGAAWDVRSARDLAAHLAYEFAGRTSLALAPSGTTDAAGASAPLPESVAESRRLWNTLYARARTHPDQAAALRPAVSALDYRNHASLSTASLAGLFSAGFSASLSQLESFAACPFQHFARYPLKLRPRPQAQLRPMDVGTVHHAVLEHLAKKLVAERRSLADLDDKELTERLEESFTHTCANSPEARLSRRSRDAWLLARARRQLERVLRAQRAAAQLGCFRPAGAEVHFGMEGEGSLPALEIDTPAGRRISLRGRIDRVDAGHFHGHPLAVVIDYKLTRDKRLNLANVYHGLALQLIGYLLVLEQHGARLLPDFDAQSSASVAPAAAFYVSLADKYEKVDHPSVTPPGSGPAALGVYPPRGILDLARMPALDRNFDRDKRSSIYQAALTKSGTISRMDSCDVAPHEHFERLLAWARRRIGELADEILDGRADILPFRLATESPCAHCDFRPLCRFEFPTTPIRNLEPVKRSRVLDKVAGTGVHP